MKNEMLIQIKNDILRKKDFVFISGISSIFFTLLLIFPVYDAFLKYMPGISDFSNHAMSAASAADLNIASRINSYLLMFLIFSILMITFFTLIYVKCHDGFNAVIDKNVKGYIRDTSLIGIAVILASVFTASKDYAAYIIGVAVILGWIFINQKNEKKDFDILIWCILISAPMAIYTYILAMRYDSITKLFQKQIMQQLQISSVALFSFAWIFIVIGIYFVSQRVNKALPNSNKDKLQTYKSAVILGGIPILFTGVIQSILLESQNILNKKFGVVFGRPYLLYTVLMFIATIISILLFVYFRNHKHTNINASNIIYKLYMPVILITLVCMISQPWRMSGAGNEYFEMANHGLSVDQFFRFGSIPIIESFDAHMLSNQIFAFIYSWLNGYEPWAAFLYNNYLYYLYIIPMFYILRKLIGATNSFLIIVCFPLLTNLFSTWYLLSGLIAICIIRMISSPKTTDYYLFWVTVVFLCFYRLDLGFSALLGGLLIYFITCYTFKQKIYIKKVVLPGGILASITLVLFTILCLLKGISPIDRFNELIKLCMSNQSWAYTSVGNSDMLAYAVGYYVLPLITIICAVWIVGKNVIINRGVNGSTVRNSLDILNKDAFIMFTFFTAFFIFNAARGIVRHSFAEGTIVLIIGTIPLALLSFSVINKNSKNCMFKFLTTALTIVVIINVNTASYKGLGSSLVSNAVLSPSYQEQYTQPYVFNGTRVNGSVRPSDAEHLKSVLDTVLDQKETYYDFASVDYFYALVGRKNPVYVNQSPLMISDDTTQSYALNQIKEANPPIVIMPINGTGLYNIDGIDVDYKYYMISEYIYDNYEPLIRLPMFDIYCLKENKELYTNELSEKGLLNKTLYTGNFNFAHVQQLFYNSSKGQMGSDGNISIIPNGNDPYVVGFLNQIKTSYPKIKESVGVKIPTQLKIDFYTKSAGSIQLYYVLKDGEEFSEQNSEVFPINADGQYSAVFDLPAVPYEIRIDVDTKELALKGMNISQGLQSINNQPETWVRNLGEIPRLWAENGGEKIFLEAPSLKDIKKETKTYTINTVDIQQNKPMYLMLELESETNCNATIDIGDSKNKLGEFNFTVSKGKHSYAIRLSTDYHWWGEKTKNISFLVDQPVNITKCCFIPTDSKMFYDANNITIK